LYADETTAGNITNSSASYCPTLCLATTKRICYNNNSCFARVLIYV